MPEERLQKIIARAGVASRRKAEELIQAGRVTVNGAVVSALGSKADLERDHVKVDGKLLRAPQALVYIALNKPRGCLTTRSDPQQRKTVMDYVKGLKVRVYPVGRLDYDSEGLLLLTNDGEFAARMMAPRHQIEKTYVVKVNGTLSDEQEELFRSGVPLHGKRTAPAGLKRLRAAENPWYEVKLREGRNQQIRLMFQHLGLRVEKLRRVRVGFLALDMPPGEFRHLTAQEVQKFRRLLGLDKELE